MSDPTDMMHIVEALSNMGFRIASVFDPASIAGLDPPPRLRTVIVYGKLPYTVREGGRLSEAEGEMFEYTEREGHLGPIPIQVIELELVSIRNKTGTLIAMHVVDYNHEKQMVVWLGLAEVEPGDGGDLRIVTVAERTAGGGISLDDFGTMDEDETFEPAEYGTLEIDRQIPAPESITFGEPETP